MRIIQTVLVFLAAAFCSSCTLFTPSPLERELAQLPKPKREFRAAWIATVTNIDWPSRPGLPVSKQKEEAIAILDKAAELHLNALIFQVRPHCDALYKSPLEPWSWYLTGKEGEAPDPFYDPLSFWIGEAHRRGIELHAWFNPYRAHHPEGGAISDQSIIKTRPELVRKLKAGYWWLDPALNETKEYTTSVVMDVVKRYDINGVHFDDYFYPYPSYNKGGDFPDGKAWDAYRRSGGGLPRGDWRRRNVNDLIETLHEQIKAVKPHVKFGISPFGIWRPRHPPSIRGLDQYNVLYSDAKLWLREGWVDFMTPQLYWSTGSMQQSFPLLLRWWHEQNLLQRNLWPGLYTNKRTIAEIINQVMITRAFDPVAPGQVHFSMKAFLDKKSERVESLTRGPYRRAALVPPSPWLDSTAPPSPKITAERNQEKLVISWPRESGTDVFRWVLYCKKKGRWSYEIINSCDIEEDHRITKNDPRNTITHVALSSVDRTGNESTPSIVKINSSE